MAQYADQYNTNGTGYEYIGQMTWSPTQTATVQGGYTARIAGLPKFIFMPNADSVNAANLSSTTYMCDRNAILGTAFTWSVLGNTWCYGSHGGMFNRELLHGTNPPGACGTRLVYKHVEGGCLTLLIILSLNQMQLLRRLHLLAMK